MLNKKVQDELRGYLFMLIGCLAYGASTSLFLAPNTIVAGGISGLSVLINHLNENLPIGMVTIALNIPILICGIKFQGWKFIFRCLITVATLGVVTDLLEPLGGITNDGVLASLYGGICQGIGIGLFVRYEFSSGGTELLGRLFKRWFKILKIPVWVGILDGIIVLLGSFITKNPNNMLYALIVVFVSTKVSEMVLVGVEKSKLCIIITDKGTEISDELLRNSPRGVTMLDGQGMYTKRDRDVILTCVKNNQLTQLKQIVKSIDEHAFIIINDSVEVRGQGFQSLQDNN
jgi:uncharacterized membrane-anchored protein YitT (DUF2179 family)